MARQTLVRDASVGVKWFSVRNEPGLAQALALRDGHLAGDIHIAVPHLFCYEVINALVHKKSIPTEEVSSASEDLFSLGLAIVPVTAEAMTVSATLARECRITIYDACSLVTASPRHQGPALGCKVIPLEEWRNGGSRE